ncbi:Outer membrane protein assembly factor BamB, contains PQQ-like beta-propeller repeat [Neorhodopirellula lusitana]|uniref:Outer membrane protein assembly factor BamB, contains PQQ-like beta-propeller repeat n=1 Tax=Neorhodopirellula lusitana TaxID=445327 RepID=A0ABY1PXT5_9BACT|nr:PQQ-binding-like beta-propeller repeat protein [Neorhodopirellula lusitana]SMP51441.1 Outer membrane protein assembly factor BamB, contains PQQ-like beta-propeller repeat [Neorhodopirellula lusitana]
MKTIVALIALLITSLSAATSLAQESTQQYRHWTTSSGRRSDVRLKLIERTTDSIRLQREDNQKIAVLPLQQLSQADLNFLNRLTSNSPTPQATPPQTTPSSASESDWPQWRGSNRDGVSTETNLLDQWPSGGPNLDWTVTGIGEGYSTPAVSNGHVFVLGAKGNSEQMFCLSAVNGNEVWSAPLGKKANGGGYPGPRGTPTVDGDRVYAIGSDGTLVSVNRANGTIAWKKNLKADFGGRCGHWDYAESPLIDGDRLICTPGGERATVVALRKSNGMPIWQGSAAELNGGYTTASYASPIAATINGQPQYIVFLHGGVVGFDAKTGRGLWHYDAPANDTANCSTPLVIGNAVFAASGYGTGGGKAILTGKDQNWNTREEFFVQKFESHHGGFVFLDGYLYGTNNSVLLCVDWKTGDIRWQNRCVGKGSISAADGMLYVRGERGDIALVKATPNGYEESGRFSQPDRSDKNAWPHPVIANGNLYIRDQDRLLSFHIR